MPVKLLAVETATEACSAALSVDGEIRARFEIAPRRHTELVIAMIDDLLASAALPVAELDAIAFGAGPGSFTGVRIAAAVTQGIALAHDLPVCRISTLAALAQGAWRERRARCLFPAIDARKQEIYWAHYRVLEHDDTVTCVHPDTLGASGSIAVPEAGAWLGIGTGWAAHQETLLACTGSIVDPVDSILYPHAADIAALAVTVLKSGGSVSAEQALPIYLRPGVDVSPH